MYYKHVRYIVSLILLFTFILNSIGYSSSLDNLPIMPNDKLAPGLLTADDGKNIPLGIELICETIEKRAESGKRVEDIDIKDLMAWADQSQSENQFENVGFYVFGNELYVVIGHKYFIRYFNPSQLPARNEYKEKHQNTLIDEKILPSGIQRERYRIRVDLLDAIFKRIIQEAGLTDKVRVEYSIFDVNERQYSMAELHPDGTTVVHPEFVLDYDDIKSSGIGFDYTFSDGISRWVDIADSIAYRVAMHEFKLPGRLTGGHGYIDDQDEFAIDYDEVTTRMVGRKYSLVDEAASLWYLHSYKINDFVRYNNDNFRRQLNWIFTTTDKDAVKARNEFPNLVRDRKKRQEAIKLALMINKAFFIDRSDVGIGTQPLYEKLINMRYAGDIKYSEGSVRSTEGDETRNLAANEEYVEIPYIGYRGKPERELNERNAEMRACIETQHDIEMILSDLKVLVSEYRKIRAQCKIDKRAMSQEENTLICNWEGKIIASLRELYSDIPINVPTGRKYQTYRNTLRKHREELNGIYRLMDIAGISQDQKMEDRLKRLNLSAIKNNLIILKLQILLTGMTLRGLTNRPNRGLAWGAAISLLDSAINSTSVALKIELGHRIDRLKKDYKMVETKTADWENKLVQTFRIGDFDIELQGEDVNAPITIREQRWIVVTTYLDKIRRLVKRREVPTALEMLDRLMKLYSIRYVVVREKYKKIAADLRAIRDMVRSIPEINAPPETWKNAYTPVVNSIKDLESKITHPKQRIWLNVPYDSLTDGIKSRFEIIKKYLPECAKLRRCISDIKHYIILLDKANRRGRISERDRGIVYAGLVKYNGWAARGLVDEKDYSSLIDLSPAIDLLENNDFKNAALSISKTVNRLETRLSNIDNIVFHEKEKAEALCAEFRDVETKSLLRGILRLASNNKFGKADKLQEKLREKYFNGYLIEPGYIRAEAVLRNLTVYYRAGERAKLERHVVRMEKIKTLIKREINLAQADIENKNMFRIKIIRPDGKSESRYINPGVTIGGLLRMLNIGVKTHQVTIGKGWVEPKDLKQKLPDNAVVTIRKAITKPMDQGRDKGVRATEGDNYRYAGYWQPGAAANVISGAIQNYVNESVKVLRETLVDDKTKVLIRLPIEKLEDIGEANARTFIKALQTSENVSIELFYSCGDHFVTTDDYKNFGVVNRPFKNESTRENTLTLFVADKNNPISQDTELIEKIKGGPKMTIQNTIIVPVGIGGVHISDFTGIARSTVLGLMLMRAARDNKSGKLDKELTEKIYRNFIELCEDTSINNIDLTEEELLNVAFGNTAKTIRALNKLIKLLPIEPLNPDELKDIYEKLGQVITAA